MDVRLQELSQALLTGLCCGQRVCRLCAFALLIIHASNNKFVTTAIACTLLP
jgi:hypothetical protein